MTETGKLTRRTAELLLSALIIARATAYMFSKLLLQSMGQFTLLGIRSAIAFILLAVVCFPRLRKADRKDALFGTALGASFFIVMCFELAGLKSTSSVSVSFEENTAVVLVPLLLAVLRRKMPDRHTIQIMLLCGLGIFLLNFRPDGFEFKIGDFFGMMAAFSYALTIILTARIGAKGDPIRIGIFQVGTMAVLSLIAAFIFENPALPSGGTEWSYMLYLAIVCSAFGFTLQPFAQSGTTAERAGVICALNPVTAAILGALFLNESLTITGIAGAVLILTCIIRKE